MKYQELKDKHRKALDEFTGIFWAFSEAQFHEGMTKVKLDADNQEHLKQIATLGSGGFIRKDRIQAWKDRLQAFDDDLEAMKADPVALEEAITYELENHEYGYTYDATQALATLGLSELDVDPQLLQRAKNEALKSAA